jgi:pilus assembly protein CpaE
MYRAMVISTDESVRRKVHSYLTDLGLISDIIELDHTPGELELGRIVRLRPPHLILLEVSSLQTTQRLLTVLEEHSPGTSVIALSQVADQRTVRQLMLMGVKGFVPVPISRPVLVEVLRKLIEQIDTGELGRPKVPQLYSFLPSKGGSGASTLACHFSSSLARELAPGIANGKIGRVLFMDLDLNGGVGRYLFDTKDTYTLGELIESGVQLDGTYWPRFVTRVDALDVIIGGRTNPRRPLLPTHLRPMLEYAAERYSVICADLTGNWEAFALEVLRQSSGIFLVCCTDLCSVRLAQERMRLLEQFDLSKRVGVLVNRFPDRLSISSSRIADEIGAPVVGEFEYEDRKVQDALANGKLVSPDSSTGKQLQKMAQRLCWEPLKRNYQKV